MSNIREDRMAELEDLKIHLVLTRDLLEKNHDYHVNSVWLPDTSFDDYWKARFNIIKELNNMIFYYEKNIKRLERFINKETS